MRPIPAAHSPALTLAAVGTVRRRWGGPGLPGKAARPVGGVRGVRGQPQRDALSPVLDLWLPSVGFWPVVASRGCARSSGGWAGRGARGRSAGSRADGGRSMLGAEGARQVVVVVRGLDRGVGR